MYVVHALSPAICDLSNCLAVCSVSLSTQPIQKCPCFRTCHTVERHEPWNLLPTPFSLWQTWGPLCLQGQAGMLGLVPALRALDFPPAGEVWTGVLRAKLLVSFARHSSASSCMALASASQSTSSPWACPAIQPLKRLMAAETRCCTNCSRCQAASATCCSQALSRSVSSQKVWPECQLLPDGFLGKQLFESVPVVACAQLLAPLPVPAAATFVVPAWLLPQHADSPLALSALLLPACWSLCCAAASCMARCCSSCRLCCAASSMARCCSSCRLCCSAASFMARCCSSGRLCCRAASSMARCCLLHGPLLFLPPPLLQCCFLHGQLLFLPPPLLCHSFSVVPLVAFAALLLPPWPMGVPPVAFAAGLLPAWPIAVPPAGHAATQLLPRPILPPPRCGLCMYASWISKGINCYSIWVTFTGLCKV